jgi:hypothetical protein
VDFTMMIRYHRRGDTYVWCCGRCTTALVPGGIYADDAGYLIPNRIEKKSYKVLATV